jgi:hypothetical protein
MRCRSWRGRWTGAFWKVGFWRGQPPLPTRLMAGLAILKRRMTPKIKREM